MYLKRILCAVIISIYSIILSPLSGIQDLWGSTFPLDEESVFCSYFIMSGDKPDEQDIEEFCFQSGRPAFTSFKPSEIFMRNSIKKERTRITERIEELKKDSLLIWSLKCEVSYGSSNGRYWVIINEKDLPQPTPYINSKMSEEGSKSLRKTLNSLINQNSGSSTKKEIDINIFLKPE